MLTGVLRDNEAIILFLIDNRIKEGFKELKYIEDAWQYFAVRKNIGLYRDEEYKYILLNIAKLRIKKAYCIKLIDKKYFDSEKIREKNQKQKEGNNSIDRGIFNKEKIKRIKKIIDLDELIEEEVERRIWEREQAEEDTSVAEDMKRIHHKSIESIKIGMEWRNTSKRNFLHVDECKLMRDSLFQTYLMKDRTDQSRLKIRDKLRFAVNNRSEKGRFNKSKEEKTQLAKTYLQENTKNLALLTKGVSGDQITQSKQIN